MWQTITGILTTNVRLKLVALLLAYGMWLFVTTEEMVYQDVSAPVQFVNLPANYTISGKKIESVRLRIQAPDSILNKLTEGSIDIRLDLSGARLGTQVFRLSREQCRVPFGVKVGEIFPTTITLTVEKVIEKMVPVNPALEGSAAPGYEVKQVKSSPAAVRISGPQSDVEAVDAVSTSLVFLAKPSGTVTEQVALDVGNPNLQILGSNKAKVTVVIGEVVLTREIKGVPIKARACKYDVRLSPPTVTVSLRGPAPALAKVDPASIKAEVDLTDCKAGRTTARAPIRIYFDGMEEGQDLEILSFEPSTARAVVAKR